MAGSERGFSLRRIILIRLVSISGPFLVKLLGSTWRIDWKGEEKLNKLREDGGKVLYAFWHSHILPLTYVYRDRGARIMVSRHSDGELVAALISKMGYIPVRGSSTSGGMAAAREFARDNEGSNWAITPDGPRGPRQVVQPGIIYVASRGRFNLVPVAAEASSKWELNSWDRFMIPKPFSRVKVTAGDPIQIPQDLPDEGIEESCRMLGGIMNEMTRQLSVELSEE